MKLQDIVDELKKEAEANNIDIFIDNTASKFHFIPVINEQGVVGAVGEYMEEDKVIIGYFILNESVVKYALDEGFKKEDIYKFFKNKLFKEVNKQEFFDIMIKKNY